MRLARGSIYRLGVFTLRLDANFGPDAYVVAGSGFAPHVSFDAGIRTLGALWISAVQSLVVVALRLGASVRRYAYVIARNRLAPHIPLDAGAQGNGSLLLFRFLLFWRRELLAFIEFSLLPFQRGFGQSLDLSRYFDPLQSFVVRPRRAG